MKSIRRIFIANRGEIALRVIRTCRQLGLETVLGVSQADRDSLPARQADRSLCLGPGRPGDSYLRVETVVHAAIASGCDALHPGYGFLSERPALARLCEQEQLILIGPTAAQLEAVGDKLKARAHAQAAGVPVVPGGSAATVAEALQLAQQIGAPLLVKAVGGGGGRGMKPVRDLKELPEVLALASAEAGAAFGDARVYLERLVGRARHVEVQVLGDGAGEVLQLGERDCSVQRRYQKLIEETPAPGLLPELRSQLLAAAVSFARHLNYRGAGTVEFLVDVERNTFYFLEMNARIQVEHPVTEAVTGIDLVAEQIRIAAGEGFSAAAVAAQHGPRGCAIECRINAEDPAHDFRPSPGTVTEALWPEGPGVRVDTHIERGARVPPFYDSLLGKIIALGDDRPAALAKLQQAIAATRVSGVATNLGFHQRALADARFAAGGVDTGFVESLK